MTMYRCNMTELNKVATSLPPAPKGNYNAHITMDSKKTTKKGEPFYILTFRISDGEYKNRFIDKMLFLDNQPEEGFLDYGKIFMKQLLAATGLDHMNDFEELRNIPVSITVGIKEASEDYPAKNVIYGVGKPKDSDFVGDEIPTSF